MPPKTKGNKKQAGQWEKDTGDLPDPIAEATLASKLADHDLDKAANDAVEYEEMDHGGGLLAALRKNKNKRAKKGKAVEDVVDSSDPPGADRPTIESDLNGKAPQEATFEEEDVFTAPSKKGRDGKKQPEILSDDEEDEEGQEGGGLKSKREKEKEKKEREKARKKEQVRHIDLPR